MWSSFGRISRKLLKNIEIFPTKKKCEKCLELSLNYKRKLEETEAANQI